VGLDGDAGQTLADRLALLALGLSITGYVAVRVAWRVAVVLKWRARKSGRQG